MLKFKDFLSYNTGKYKIYSYQNGFNMSKIEKIYKDIETNNFDYTSNSAIIAGCKEDNTFYITEGNHRMLAALKYFKLTNDYQPGRKTN